MTQRDRDRFDRIWDAGQQDGAYAEKLRRNGELEKRYFAVLAALTPEQQDVIQDFVSSCEGLSWRMLEFACETLRFPNEK